MDEASDPVALARRIGQRRKSARSVSAEKASRANARGDGTGGAAPPAAVEPAPAQGAQIRKPPRAAHAAVSLLTDERSREWHALLSKRRSAGKRLIETPEELERLFADYAVSISKRPFITAKPTRDGGEFLTKQELPLSQAGVCAFAGMSVRTWMEWKKPTSDQHREDLAEAIDAIETKIYAINLEKGLTTELNPQLTGRFLGISEKKEVSVAGARSTEKAEEQVVQIALDMLATPEPKGKGGDEKSAPSPKG